MKRFFAGLLVFCSLLMLFPAALATEASSPEDEVVAPLPAVGQDSPAETPEAPPPAPQEQAPEAEAQGPDLEVLKYETAIHHMEVRVNVDQDGFATVHQTVELQILGAPETLRFSFPAGAKKCDIAGYHTKSETEGDLRYLTIKNKQGFTGTQTFTMTYTMSGLVAGGEASQILNLPLLSMQDYKIGYLIFQINLPAAFASKPYFSSGYYGDLVEEIMTVEVRDNTIVGTVDDIIRDSDTLAMTLVLPEEYFHGSYGESRLSPVLTAVILAVFLFTLLYWFRTLRNGPLHVQSRTLPPDGVNPGDVPYLLAGGQADFNMLVTHWAILGYLSFYINHNGNIILRRRMDMGNERRPFEQKLFTMLFGQADVCDGASLRYKKVGEKAMQVIPRYWSRRLYEKRSGSVSLVHGLCALCCALSTMLAMDAVGPQKAHFLYLILGLVAGAAMAVVIFKACGAYYLNNWLLAGGGIVCGLALLVVGGLGGATYVALPSVVLTAFLGWQTTHGGRRRPYGDKVIAQTLGYRRFLKTANANTMLQLQQRDPQYFYKLLPFAEAMGLSNKVIPLFANCRLEPCQWYESARANPTDALSFYERYADMLDLLNISLKK